MVRKKVLKTRRGKREKDFDKLLLKALLGKKGKDKHFREASKYIHRMLGRGHHEKDVKNALLSVGWPEEFIEGEVGRIKDILIKERSKINEYLFGRLLFILIIFMIVVVYILLIFNRAFIGFNYPKFVLLFIIFGVLLMSWVILLHPLIVHAKMVHGRKRLIREQKKIRRLMEKRKKEFLRYQAKLEKEKKKGEGLKLRERWKRKREERRRLREEKREKKKAMRLKLREERRKVKERRKDRRLGLREEKRRLKEEKKEKKKKDRLNLREERKGKGIFSRLFTRKKGKEVKKREVAVEHKKTRLKFELKPEKKEAFYKRFRVGRKILRVVSLILFLLFIILAVAASFWDLIYAGIGLVLALLALFGFIKTKKPKEKVVKEEEKEKTIKVEELLKRPNIELGRYETDLDALYRLLEQRGSMKLSAIVKSFKVKKKQVEGWANILQDHNLAQIRYPAIGEPELMKFGLSKAEKKSLKKQQALAARKLRQRRKDERRNG